MAEYIERASLDIPVLPKEYRNYSTFNLDDAYEDGWNDAIACLLKIPTADVVEVVRCRDCKHCDPENHHCDHHMGTAAPLRRKHDDFCSYGEKRRDKDGTT